MSIPIKTGLYIIQSFGQDLFIGRNVYEDLSLHPKQVISLPHGIEAPKWIIEELHDGAYHLRIGGALTGERDRKVWAFLLAEEGPTEWLIKPGNFPNTYFISTRDGKTWSLPTKEPFTQIPIGLIGGEEKNLLWRIIPLLKE